MWPDCEQLLCRGHKKTIHSSALLWTRVCEVFCPGRSGFSCRCWGEGRRRRAWRSWEWRCRLRPPRTPCPAERRASLSWLWGVNIIVVQSVETWRTGEMYLFDAKWLTSFRWRTCPPLRRPTPGWPGPRRGWNQTVCFDQSRNQTEKRDGIFGE